MTLRSEMYFRILKSSSIVGRGVCGSAGGLTMFPKDSKREEIRA
jgi:hypothetical protein